MSDRPRVTRDDLDECWCCGGLHDTLGSLCPNCDEADCTHFGDECQSDHKPVVPDGGRPAESPQQLKYVDECPACGSRFVGMDLVDFRDNHAAEECPKAPLTVDQLCETEYNGCRPGGFQNGL